VQEAQQESAGQQVESPAKIRQIFDPKGRHDIRQSQNIAFRHLRYGSWYENYDYSLTIDEENMLAMYPKSHPDAVTGEAFPRCDAFRRTPVSRVYRIFKGED
jgi:hypothetical protein